MEYHPVGRMRVSGCANVRFNKYFFVKFEVGDRVYVRQKAFEGILDSVVIKRINRVELNRSRMQGSGYVVNYVDTTNRVWMGEELVSQETAVDMSRLHWENVLQSGREILQEDGCVPMSPEGCR